jgi:enediyne biosynthesis protein E4
MILLAACSEPPLPPETAGYDRLTLAGPAAEEDRFWGAGVVVFDADGDGDLDLVAPGPHTTRYFAQQDGAFVEQLAVLPTADTAFAVGGAAADLDGDEDLDLVISRWGPEDLVWFNEGGRFVARATGIEIASHSQSASFGDADLDGDLDLAIAGHGEVEGGEQVIIPGPSDGTRLWVNDGAGGFTDRPDLLTDDVRDGYAYVVGWTELDGDPLPDWIVANDYPVFLPTAGAVQGPDGFAVATGLGLVQRAAGMGLAMDDVSGDGVDDFLIPVWDRLLYLRSAAGGVWTESALAAGLQVPERAEPWIGWGAEWADLDLDGDLDGVVAFGHLDTLAPLTAGGASAENAELQRLAVYWNGGAGFTEDAAAVGLDDLGVWRGFVVADLDRDGTPDLVRRDLRGDIVIDLAPASDRGWLRVIPEPPSRAPGAVVTIGIGEQVQRRVVHAGGTSLASGGPPEVWFGLGEAQEVDWIEVHWPDGAVERVGATATGEVRVRRP